MKKSFGAPETVAVVSILADKDATALLEALDETAKTFIITQSSSPRAITVDELAQLARNVFGAERVKTAESALTAMTLARREVADNGAILVTGSITLVGDVLKNIQLNETESDGDES
jgi:dihydrofolate synthase/folylpolyglutamate synthase